MDKRRLLGECDFNTEGTSLFRKNGHLVSVPVPSIAVAWDLHKCGRNVYGWCLLHEMCHLKLSACGHGKRFDGEKKRLMGFKKIRDMF